MIRMAVLAGLLAACADNAEHHVNVLADYVEPAPVMGQVRYSALGSFQISVTATFTEDDHLLAGTAAPRATVAITNAAPIVPGSVTSAVISLAPSEPGGGFHGTATLVWPPGGPVGVEVLVSGATEPETVTAPLVTPQIVLRQPLSLKTNLGLCFESTTESGQLAVHLEKGTFAGGSQTDQSLALVPGPCDAALTVAFPVPLQAPRSHVPFSISANSETTVAATLAGMMSAPPVAVLQTPPLSVVSPQKTALTLMFQNPPTSAAAGTIVTLVVKARDVGPTSTDDAQVPVAFSISPDVALAPESAVTGQADGEAKTSFAMPALGGGSLVVTATSGAVQATPVVLTN